MLEAAKIIFALVVSLLLFVLVVLGPAIPKQLGAYLAFRKNEELKSQHGSYLNYYYFGGGMKNFRLLDFCHIALWWAFIAFLVVKYG